MHSMLLALAFLLMQHLVPVASVSLPLVFNTTASPSVNFADPSTNLSTSSSGVHSLLIPANRAWPKDFTYEIHPPTQSGLTSLKFYYDSRHIERIPNGELLSLLEHMTNQLSSKPANYYLHSTKLYLYQRDDSSIYIIARAWDDSVAGRLTRDRVLDTVRIYTDLVHQFGAEEMEFAVFAANECGLFTVRWDAEGVQSLRG